MISTSLALAAGAWGFLSYKDGLAVAEARAAKWPTLHRILANKYYVDEGIELTLLGPLRKLGTLLWKVFDVIFIDGLGVRLPGTSEAGIDDAFDRAEVLRTWPMRGTIHIVHPRNARWLLDLTGRRALLGLKARWDYLGLDRATVDRAAEVLGSALKGTRLTRSECLRVLEDAGIDTSGQRSYQSSGRS